MHRINVRKNISHGSGLIEGSELLLFDGHALERHGIPTDAEDLCFAILPPLGVRMPHIREVPEAEYTMDIIASRITPYYGFHRKLYRKVIKPRIIFP